MKKIMCAIFVLGLAASSSATIINIPADYPTIQQGINATVDGDTVLVQPGTYVENINFNGHNIVTGSLFLTTGDTSYVSTTIIDGDSTGTVVIFNSGENSTCILTGFTLLNGDAIYGGAVCCSSYSDPIITNNIITENIGRSSGGGIYVYNSGPEIAKNTIIDNWSPGMEFGMGGGICCSYSNSLISDNIIIANAATGHLGGGAGGGIFCEFSTLSVINNVISGNSAGAGGGGVYASRSNVLAYNNQLIENSSFKGGGISLFDSDSAVVAGNRITLNSASSGSGIYLQSSNSTLVNNLVYGNNAQEYGGGICCEFSASAILNNAVYGNSAQLGGGIYTFLTSYPTITNTIFWADSATMGGSEIGGDNASWPTITYCDIQDIIWPGEGNINVEPLFRDPLSGDFHLMSIACGDSIDSPCIDAGDPNILDSLLDCSWGLGGLRSDMGAYGGGDSITVGILNDINLSPNKFLLIQNYPNPFNASTTIRFILPEPGEIRLTIYDILGRRVGTLLDEYREAGVHTVTIDASNLSSGVYFYRLRAGEIIETKRMLLLK